MNTKNNCKHDNTIFGFGDMKNIFTGTIEYSNNYEKCLDCGKLLVDTSTERIAGIDIKTDNLK